MELELSNTEWATEMKLETVLNNKEQEIIQVRVMNDKKNGECV